MIKLNKPIYPGGIDAEEFKSVYPDFENELIDIVEYSGNKEKFKKMFQQRIQWIRTERDNCCQNRQWCERLRHDPAHCLYSLKIKNNQNIRILFIFYGEKMSPILLCAFKEIARGGNSAVAYEQYIRIAHNRVKALIENGLIKEEEIACYS